MKTRLLFYSALFASLAALGIGMSLDRNELDEMLYKLKNIGQPGGYFDPGITAMCYASPVQASFHSEYICPSCGERSYYYDGEEELKSLENARKGAEQLRKLGLEIEVSEQAFCHKCNPDKSAFRQRQQMGSPVGTGIDFGEKQVIPDEKEEVKETPEESNLTIDEESPKEFSLPVDEWGISSWDITISSEKQVISGEKEEVKESPKEFYLLKAKPL